MLCSTAHFFQPHSGFMAPHQSRSLEGGFCSLSSNFFFSSLTCSVFQRRSDFKDRISSPQWWWQLLNHHIAIFTTDNKKKEYNRWRNAHTHTHTHLHTEPSHGAHRPHVCTPPPFCSTNGKICPFPQASNLKPSPLEHLWHFELAQVDQAPPASRLKLLQGFGHLELVQLDQAPRASRLKLLQCLWHLELAQVDQVL